jgi:hypothetical protein
MGAAESVLKEVEVGEALPLTSGIYRIWTDVHPCVYRGRRKTTVFIRSFAETDSEETRKFFENGIQVGNFTLCNSVLSNVLFCCYRR